jgi:hypothetical protein
MRGLGDQPLAAWSPTPERRHVGLGPGLVDEDQAPGIKLCLILLPLRAPSRDPRPVPLAGEQRFF